MFVYYLQNVRGPRRGDVCSICVLVVDIYSINAAAAEVCRLPVCLPSAETGCHHGNSMTWLGLGH